MGFEKDSYYQEKLSKMSLAVDVFLSLEFEECEFESCSFADCKFERCKFIDCRFNDCSLTAINPANSRFTDISFSKCSLIGFDWTRASQVRDLKFSDSVLNYSSFKTMKIPKVEIINCTAKEVDFTETDLTSALLTNTDFEDSIFFKTDLSEADLRGATNYLIDVKNNTLHKTHFSYPEVVSLLNALDIIID
jgi:fluoroquinolone resistance protein